MIESSFRRMIPLATSGSASDAAPARRSARRAARRPVILCLAAVAGLVGLDALLFRTNLACWKVTFPTGLDQDQRNTVRAGPRSGGDPRSMARIQTVS